jgi:hypothetical protein
MKLTKTQLKEIIREELLRENTKKIPNIINKKTRIIEDWVGALEDVSQFAGRYINKKYKKGLHGFFTIEFDSLDPGYYDGEFLEWFYRDADNKNGMDINLKGEVILDEIDGDDGYVNRKTYYLFKHFSLDIRVRQVVNSKSKKVENINYKLPISPNSKTMADIIMKVVEPILKKYSK